MINLIPLMFDLLVPVRMICFSFRMMRFLMRVRVVMDRVAVLMRVRMNDDFPRPLTTAAR